MAGSQINESVGQHSNSGPGTVDPKHIPVIVGVGQYVERLDQPGYRGLSPTDLAAAALRAALADTGCDTALASIDAIGAVRTFEDSSPRPAPFGKPDKFPRAVAARLGIDPPVAVLEQSGGQSPLTLIASLAQRIADGEIRAAVAVGAEAISTVRHLRRAGESRDWSETHDGAIEDHGTGNASFMRRHNLVHGLVGAAPAYALFENARRARLGLSKHDYVAKMGQLFAPFTTVAAANPYSAAAMQPLSPDEIVTPSERNRIIADPYMVKLVSRDQVNQGAAVIVMSLDEARRLGIDERRFVFLHACAFATERDIPVRADLGAYRAADASLHAALAMAGKTADDIAAFDFYSCFPIAVFAAAIDSLGLSPDDPRGLTVTGGLPYFGGAGNNYSTHALVAMTERLRAAPGSFGLVGANGGFLSKYGVAILSTVPTPWRGCAIGLQDIEDAPAPRLVRDPKGVARILTYTIAYEKGVPARAIVVGELADGGRFLANQLDDDTLAAMLDMDPLGATIHVHATKLGNRFAFDPARITAAFPTPTPALRETYEYILVARRGHVLEVTINRPEVRNCLSPEAQDELDGVFDAFEADPELWVAILTASGDKAFCAGADLRRAASGKPTWQAKGGFAGLTRRKGRTKPVIAAVNGVAFGGGFEACLAADLVVADPEAKFGLTEVKVGLVAAEGGVVRMPRQVPRKLAMEMLLTGRIMDAEEAARLGFVNRISARGSVMAEARRLADEIAGVSPNSVRLTMKALALGDRYPHADDAAQALIESDIMDELFFSEDMAEGLAAFAAKRPPVWKNR